MSKSAPPEVQAKREYAQLLRLHDRTLLQLQRIRDDLTSSGTVELIKEIKARTGSEPSLADVTAAVEEALRSLKLSDSHVRSATFDDPGTATLEGVPNLPAHLQRFLAERAQSPAFSFDVIQDEVRGWVIRWKEYTNKGTVRGYGQFSERPYAWLED
jgi:hypothetical protein